MHLHLYACSTEPLCVPSLSHPPSCPISPSIPPLTQGSWKTYRLPSLSGVASGRAPVAKVSLDPHEVRFLLVFLLLATLAATSLHCASRYAATTLHHHSTLWPSLLSSHSHLTLFFAGTVSGATASLPGEGRCAGRSTSAYLRAPARRSQGTPCRSAAKQQPHSTQAQTAKRPSLTFPFPPLPYAVPRGDYRALGHTRPIGRSLP